MFGMGMAMGPVIGGVLVGAVGWRGIFWVNIPVGLCAIALTSVLVPESRARIAPANSVAQVLVIVILGSLVYAIIEGAYTDWRATTIRVLFAVAAVMSAVLIAWELRRKDPLIDLRYFRNPSFTAAVAIAVCAFADLGGFLFLTSIYLQDMQGDTVIDAGLHMLPTAAAMAICPFLAAWVTAKTAQRAPATAARRPDANAQHNLDVPVHRLLGQHGSPVDIRAVRHRYGHGQQPDQRRRGGGDAGQPGGPRIGHRIREPPGRASARRGGGWFGADRESTRTTARELHPGQSFRVAPAVLEFVRGRRRRSHHHARAGTPCENGGRVPPWATKLAASGATLAQPRRATDSPGADVAAAIAA